MNALEQKIATLVGERVERTAPVAGGDINQAFALTLSSGRRLFAKTHRTALPKIFLREAEGLAWLSSANALRVPQVIAATEADDLGPACLVLEYIEPGSPSPGYADTFGRGLAALHRAGAPTFGFRTPNYLATLPQDNTPASDWPSFYAERRLAPLLARAEQRGYIEPSLAKRMRRMCDRISHYTGDPEPPSRLHGDLWGGNALAATSGEPVLIDPAVYGGHREIDLAMMKLFGGFSHRVFDAYAEAYPLAPGHGERVGLYQLYPLLAHVCLFGSSYVPQLDRTLKRYD